jgi:hypothetical protein
MDQTSLRATIFLTVLLSAATSVALGQSKTLQARGPAAGIRGFDAARCLDLGVANGENNTAMVAVRNQTGAAIEHGSVLLSVAFADGTSQETRIKIANLGEGETMPVSVRLLTAAEQAEITGVEVVASNLRASPRRHLHVPVRAHFDAD